MPRRDVTIDDVVLSLIDTVNVPFVVPLESYIGSDLGDDRIGRPQAEKLPILGYSPDFVVSSDTKWSYKDQGSNTTFNVGGGILLNGTFKPNKIYTAQAILTVPGKAIEPNTVNTAFIFPVLPKICVFTYRYPPANAATADNPVVELVKKGIVTSAGKVAKVTIVFPSSGSSTIGANIEGK
jgi:hypothetical protein